MATPSTSLIVIYTEHLEACRDFYADLGLDLTEEQHGSGPVHYAAHLADGTVLELYPAPRGRTTGRLRLGLVVARPGHEPGTTHATDPDGRTIELHTRSQQRPPSPATDGPDTGAPA